MERFSKWLVSIRVNAHERYMAHRAFLKNLAALVPAVDELGDWQDKSVDELEAINKVMTNTHTVLVTAHMDYSGIVKSMGVVELIIYFPRLFRQNHEQDEAIKTLKQMIDTTTEVITFIKEYQLFGCGE